MTYFPRIRGCISERRHRALFIASLLGLANSISFGQALVAYYAFDGNANDGSGNNHHATVNGATLTTDRFGQANQAYRFDGDRDYIDLGSWTIGPNFTLSGWFNCANFGKDPMLFLLTNGAPVSGWPPSSSPGYYAYGSSWADDVIYVNFYPTGQLNFGTNSGSVACNSYVTTNEWIFLTVTSDTTATKVYKNGELVGSGSFGGVTTMARTSQFLGPIGPGLDNSWFNGSMDDIRIFDFALSASEVTSLYQTGAVPEPSSFAALAGLTALALAAFRRKRHAASGD